MTTSGNAGKTMVFELVKTIGLQKRGRSFSVFYAPLLSQRKFTFSSPTCQSLVYDPSSRLITIFDFALLNMLLIPSNLVDPVLLTVKAGT